MTLENLEQVSSKFLIEEFKETWEHYRHLESILFKYLGFYFTAIFAIIGFLATIFRFYQPVLSEGSESSAFSGQDIFLITACGAWLLLWGLTFLGLYTKLSMRKTYHVLDCYLEIRNNVRKKIYGEKSEVDPENWTAR